MGVKVESIFLQISAEADRTDKERELAEAGLTPFVLFANSPENAFLLAARPVDLEAAFAAARERADGLGAERLALRMRIFDQLAQAIETDMKYLVEEMEFPNNALLLLVEGLCQVGIDEVDAILPCAMRFTPDTMQEPDFELAERSPTDDPQGAAPEEGQA